MDKLTLRQVLIGECFGFRFVQILLKPAICQLKETYIILQTNFVTACGLPGGLPESLLLERDVGRV